MIGGGGERKTLRTVARYADLWNVSGSPETLAHKLQVLADHCAAVGRDPATIDRSIDAFVVIRDRRREAERVWAEQMAHNRTTPDATESYRTFLGSPEEVAEQLAAVVAVGFETAIFELPAPYDVETMERLIGEVKPLVDRG